MITPAVLSRKTLAHVLLVLVLAFCLVLPSAAQVVFPPMNSATAAVMSVHRPPTGLAPGVTYGPPPVPFVYDLPPGCGTTVVGGVVYNTCGGNYYRPYYYGPNVGYAPVPPPY